VSARLRARYGASPLHLLGHLSVLAFVVYALWQVIPGGGRARAENVVLWLLAGALLHDLVLLPAYALLDRAARAATRGRPALLAHLRVPAAISGVLLLVYFPLILVRADGNYVRATGHHVAGYARNWLLITAGLFLASALHYYAATRRSRRHDLKHARAAPADEDPSAANVDGGGVGLTNRGEAP
jgi:hypothetical protein